MKIAGSYTLSAPRDRVWPIIFDPGALLELIPGCDQIQANGPGSYLGTIALRLPAVNGTFSTTVKILDQREPEFCRMDGEAAGSGGSVKGQASFTLTEVGGGTLVEYEGNAVIAGPLAGMNARFVEGVAQALIRQGLGKLDSRAAAVAAAEATGPAAMRRLGAWARFVSWLRRLVGRFQA